MDRQKDGKILDRKMEKWKDRKREGKREIQKDSSTER